jgi:hypothetical protein
VFSGIVAASTVVYAFLTYRLVNETEKLRKVQTDPHILIYANMDAYAQLVSLVITNVGSGPARNLSVRFNQEIPYAEKKNLNDFGVFATGMSHVPPKYTLEYIYDYGAVLFGNRSKKPMKFEVFVEYENSTSDRFSETFPIDIEALSGLWYKGGAPKDIAHSIKNIDSALQKIAFRIDHHLGPKNIG